MTPTDPSAADDDFAMDPSKAVSIKEERSVVAIIPALNEAASIAHVVDQARQQLTPNKRPLFDRVIVVDNGSTDATAAIAAGAGAWVVHESRRGYGAACLRALSEVGDAEVIVFIDGDASTRMEEVQRLVAAIEAGAALAIGTRVKGRKEGMTLAQRFGTELACALIRLLWRVPVSDLGPFRAVTRESLHRIGMRDQAYGWTVEMQVRAIQLGMRIDEVPVSVLPRVGRSKVSGTVRGVIGAAHGIFSTIGRLWWSERSAHQRRPLMEEERRE